jgi:hypothetical protein
MSTSGRIVDSGMEMEKRFKNRYLKRSTYAGEKLHA